MEYSLAHYGIPNMKWGIRRFQNKDGTLTPEGKERYAVSVAKIEKQIRKLGNKEQAARDKQQHYNKKAATHSKQKSEAELQSYSHKDSVEKYQHKQGKTKSKLDRLNKADYVSEMQDKINRFNKKSGKYSAKEQKHAALSEKYARKASELERKASKETLKALKLEKKADKLHGKMEKWKTEMDWLMSINANDLEDVA